MTARLSLILSKTVSFSHTLHIIIIVLSHTHILYISICYSKVDTASKTAQ